MTTKGTIVHRLYQADTSCQNELYLNLDYSVIEVRQIPIQGSFQGSIIVFKVVSNERKLFIMETEIYTVCKKIVSRIILSSDIDLIWGDMVKLPCGFLFQWKANFNS